MYRCPNGDCGEPIPGSGGKATCPNCNVTCCITHEVIWQKGHNCQEYDKAAIQAQQQLQQRLDYQSSEHLISQTTKKCPSCGINMEKNGGKITPVAIVTRYVGCLHMTCICRHEFFWCCLRSYRDPEQARLHRQLCD
jgi:hypothetical protein